MPPRFSIDKKTGQLSVNGDLDHEAGGDGSDGVYDVTVTATDPNGAGASPTGAASVDVDITVSDVNEKPDGDGDGRKYQRIQH